ncbi:integrase core domain-containing protein [bacterium]|nr:integrase core domain-containing protein [bacterium]
MLLRRKALNHPIGRRVESECKKKPCDPFTPWRRAKIERYHRSMKNIILLDNYYLLMELEAQIAQWVDYYNNEPYHESLGNITPLDKN